MFLAIPYPAWIQPEIFPGVPFLSALRWYGLMYIFAFGTAFWIFKKQVNEGALNTPNYTATEDDLFSFFTFSIICLLIGARVFSALVYDTSGIYQQKPWLIFWPFDHRTGAFTGLAGMSYHGGFIGGFLGMIIWCLRKKKSVFKWIDVMAVSIPLGYTFGRLGNFLNGELFGRITTVPWGVIFPYAERFSVSLQWVKDFASSATLTIPAGTVLVNLPRHPSQLYEAIFEGVVLWVLLWILRKKKLFDGFLTCLYIIGYGTARFVIEYFREPDADIGYRIAASPDAPLYLNTSLLNISTGQVLCLGMIAGGLLLLLILYLMRKLQNSENFVISSKNVMH